MTRQEIESQHTIKNGRIADPGSFEGEPIYTPYYWDCLMSGFSDSDNGEVATFKITKEDRAMFPEIPSRKRSFKVWQSDQGFIYCR